MYGAHHYAGFSSMVAGEKLKNPAHLSLSLESYTMKLHYRTISSYRELEPRRKEVRNPDDDLNPTDRYLNQVDKFVQEAQSRITQGSAYDIASMVFANQALAHDLSSRQLAGLIEERRALSERHVRDIQWRLDELMERRPFRPEGPGFVDDHSLTEVERQIHSLEWQKRALEVLLWRQTQELRTALVDERREQETTRRRISYLAGGSYGGV